MELGLKREVEIMGGVLIWLILINVIVSGAFANGVMARNRVVYPPSTRFNPVVSPEYIVIASEAMYDQEQVSVREIDDIVVRKQSLLRTV